MMDGESVQGNSPEEGFRVGEYFVEPRLQRIRTGEDVIQVEPRVMEVLVCLAETPGQPVSKSRFMEKVWGDAVVTNDALLRCISELRKIFDDDPRNPSYVETIRKRGYRLIAPVSYGDGSSRGAEAEEPSSMAASGSRTGTASRFGHGLSTSVRSGLQNVWFWAGAATIGMFVTVLLLAQFLDGDSTGPLRTIPLTSYSGEEADPTLSPDGDRVAFVWDGGVGGSFDIYVKQIGAETPIRLTDGPADDLSPAWSPDGRRLAFLRVAAGESGIFVIPAIGGGERRVANLGAREARSLAWSPDGSILAFTAHRSPYAPYAIWLHSMETGELSTLTEPPSDMRGDVELAFSPDGRFLAFSRSTLEKVDDVYVVSIGDGRVRRVTHDNAEVMGLDWSADGRHIVFASDRHGAPSLWRVPASGGLPTWIPIAGEGTGVHHPSIARKGGRLTFVQRIRETNIWDLKLVRGELDDVRGAGRPVIASTRWDSYPDISPDGDRIAFVSNRSGSYEIWVSERDGGRPIRLTSFGGPFTETPRWAPDGRRLAFVAKEEGSADIYVLSLDAELPTRLTTEASNDKAPSWSRDGRWIYFASNRSGTWQTWKVRADGGAPRPLTTNGGFSAAESHDGQHLYFVKRNATGIWRMSVDGGPEQRVVEALQPYDWGNWIVGKEGIYFLRRDATTPVLAFYRFATEDIEVLGSVQGVPAHPSLALSSDETQLLYSRIDRRDSDVFLVDDFE